MALYIPDLRLPADSDFELWIAVRKDGSFTYNVRGNWQNGKQKAIPVPLHGRLIDVDALNLDYEVEMADDWKTAHEIANVVKYAPTIIPSEKG